MVWQARALEPLRMPTVEEGTQSLYLAAMELWVQIQKSGSPGPAGSVEASHGRQGQFFYEQATQGLSNAV